MALKWLARLEFVSLVLLLGNFATVRWPALASLVGPIHGCAYLLVIGLVLRRTGDRRTRLLAIVPGIGGLLASRRLARTLSGRQPVTTRTGARS